MYDAADGDLLHSLKGIIYLPHRSFCHLFDLIFVLFFIFYFLLFGSFLVADMSTWCVVCIQSVMGTQYFHNWTGNRYAFLIFSTCLLSIGVVTLHLIFLL